MVVSSTKNFFPQGEGKKGRKGIPGATSTPTSKADCGKKGEAARNDVSATKKN